jgi:hypothetical protein
VLGKVGLKIGHTKASDSCKERSGCPTLRLPAVGTGEVTGIEFGQVRITGHWISKDQATTHTKIAM